jgi:hypothetical protein
MILKLAKGIRAEAWTQIPGSRQEATFSAYRLSTLKVARGLVVPLSTPSPAMLAAGAAALAEIFETDTPVDDVLRIWRAMIDAILPEWEIEYERRRDAEQQMRFARELVEDRERYGR